MFSSFRGVRREVRRQVRLYFYFVDMPYKYIGRTTYQVGKPLWEILCNMKNYGVGRMIVRGTQLRYQEPCYYRILEVEAMAPEGEHRRVKVLTDRVFRGKYWGQEVLDHITYKPDFQLIPKTEEARVSGMTGKELPPGVTADIIMPATAPLPPLLREMIIQNLIDTGKPVEEPTMLLQYILHPNARIRVAKENETPMVNVDYQVKPVKPEMYAKVKEV